MAMQGIKDGKATQFYQGMNSATNPLAIAG